MIKEILHVLAKMAQNYYGNNITGSTEYEAIELMNSNKPKIKPNKVETTWDEEIKKLVIRRVYNNI